MVNPWVNLPTSPRFIDFNGVEVILEPYCRELGQVFFSEMLLLASNMRGYHATMSLFFCWVVLPFIERKNFVRFSKKTYHCFVFTNF